MILYSADCTHRLQVCHRGTNPLWRDDLWEIKLQLRSLDFRSV